MKLIGWKTRRSDRKIETYWERISRQLNIFEQYQKDWNFMETEYGERPSNNGLDIANPAFAFTTNLAKYIGR